MWHFNCLSTPRICRSKQIKATAFQTAQLPQRCRQHPDGTAAPQGEAKSKAERKIISLKGNYIRRPTKWGTAT